MLGRIGRLAVRRPRAVLIAASVVLIAMVAVGIIFHMQFMISLRREREDMRVSGLIHGESEFPLSFTLAVAILLLLLGIAAIASVVFHNGPFG